jgi:hypothetical protein
MVGFCLAICKFFDAITNVPNEAQIQQSCRQPPQAIARSSAPSMSDHWHRANVPRIVIREVCVALHIGADDGN